MGTERKNIKQPSVCLSNGSRRKQDKAESLVDINNDRESTTKSIKTQILAKLY